VIYILQYSWSFATDICILIFLECTKYGILNNQEIITLKKFEDTKRLSEIINQKRANKAISKSKRTTQQTLH